MLAFGLITLVFVYTTVVNIIERPDGVKIAAFFIAAIVVTSLISRVTRATELRVTEIELDETARRFIEEAAADGEIRIIANEPRRARRRRVHRQGARGARATTGSRPTSRCCSWRSTVARPVGVRGRGCEVTGEDRYGYRILRMDEPAVPNAIAAVLLHLRDLTGERPHVFFDWTEGNPVAHLLRFLIFGSGEVAPVTREVLREAEPDPQQRPFVHVA